MLKVVERACADQRCRNARLVLAPQHRQLRRSDANLLGDLSELTSNLHTTVRYPVGIKTATLSGARIGWVLVSVVVTPR